MASPLLVPVINWARNLRHPTLFKIIAALFVIDLAIPLDDLFPPYFLDELMLGLAFDDAAARCRVIEGQARR